MTEEDRGKPRKQYKRTVNVIPAPTPIKEAVEIFRRCWKAGRQTVTSSYDDAGIGDLEDKTAVLWGIPRTETSVFEDWYRDFYPDTKVRFARLDEPAIWDRNIISVLPKGDKPWLQRSLDSIVGLTVHHADTNSVYAAARYHVGTKGLPSIQYHLWITEDGEILLCEPFESALYHDHMGYPNYHLSVCLAGNRLENPMPEPMMDALVRVGVWSINHPVMSITLARVKGHRNYAQTDCPGWQSGWRDEFYRRLVSEH